MLSIRSATLLVSLVSILAVRCLPPPSDSDAERGSQDAPAAGGESRSFRQWCEGSDTPVAARQTIAAMMLATQTDNCLIAEDKLKFSTELNLANQDLSDLRPLREFDQIKKLDLSGNSLTIPELVHLSGFVGLTDLNLASNDLDGDASFSPNRALEELTLSGNSLAHIDLPGGLKHLRADSNQLRDVSHWAAQAPHLRWLDLRNNAIESLAGLQLADLWELQMRDNPLGTSIALSEDNCPYAAADAAPAVRSFCSRNRIGPFEFKLTCSPSMNDHGYDIRPLGGAGDQIEVAVHAQVDGPVTETFTASLSSSGWSGWLGEYEYSWTFAVADGSGRDVMIAGVDPWNGNWNTDNNAHVRGDEVLCEPSP